MQDHRQKFSVFKSIGTKEQMRAMESTKSEACVARKHLKKIGSEDKRFWSSSEADVIRSTSSDVVHQKLTLSEVMKIIRSWRSWEDGRLEASDLCQMLLLSHLTLHKNKSLKQRLIQRNLEGIGCLFFGECWKRTTIQVYNHYLDYSDLCLHCTRTTAVSTLVFLYTWNGFEIVPS